ncbi:hypothetical protein AJ80_07636 [Polytolypa hystricis UAMH7299]|uniref:UBC core domain-containing protein n=1 Tax=Polytolypa hystricis (strain UAMH7299) TaxID=1447883 RepID=A0A2B7XL60_POLH7|nr:hypothetical protein AJ80_07636 [Polytolypa hystricis UAMH7299]
MNTTLRRLMREAHELSESSSSPSPHFHAHPVSDSNFFDWHFTLAGPPTPSPYAGGIYHGRIVLPPQYPLRPPSFRFLTPSGRFEVNREICLSISGHHEETWQPAWGIRTALTAIRSFMEGDAKGQVGGIDAKEEVRREWARRSRSWTCEVCAAGRTNEEVLHEWREACRRKGVDVDESGGAGVENLPEGLSVGYRDEMGKREEGAQSGTSASAGAQESGNESSATLSAANETADPTSIPAVMSPDIQNIPAPVGPSDGLRQRLDPSSTTSAATNTPSTSTTSATSTPPTPAPAPTPITTASIPPTPLNQPTHGSTATTSPSSESAWLDRAIFALAIALIITILKKLFADELA